MSAQTFAPQAPPPSAAADSAPPPNGRDSAGRFAKGNLGGPGNPYARHTAALRRALAECVSEEEIQALGRTLYQAALHGDLAAAKLLLAYVVGKPAPPPDPDTLDTHEWSVFKGQPVDRKDVQAVLGGVQAGLACKLASIAVPALEMVQSQEFADMARRSQRAPFAEANETRPPKKARPSQKPTEANGSNGQPEPGQTDSESAPDDPPTESNGSNRKSAPDEASGRHQTGSNGKAKQKRSRWWGFGQPFRRSNNRSSGPKSEPEAVSR